MQRNWVWMVIRVLAYFGIAAGAFREAGLFTAAAILIMLFHIEESEYRHGDIMNMLKRLSGIATCHTSDISVLIHMVKENATDTGEGSEGFTERIMAKARAEMSRS